MPPSKSALARIHIARKELVITEDAYRDMLRLNFRVESAKELTERQALELIGMFQAKGWEPKVSAKPRKNPNYISIKPGPAAKQQKKVLALWHALGYDMAKLHARVKKQFGIDRFEWLENGQALHILITDLEHRLENRGAKKK